ncbi:digeranylgeranylglycerophospholipid reductase [Halorarum halobium]|uniref:digeranylgeranylglycerophospholipid reductase n=1 Tax=Halorarum halobium TaxID=3075121 RepID=UPI0028AF53EE|nr:digeranylgeranylglycerophospholipid reductase [Halobaculum sp. XH14]
MSETYDAVIAGAGPAGAQCARDIAARGYDVVVLETEGEDEFPSRSNKSTAGTFPSTMTSFGVPDDVVMNFTDSVVIESPTGHFDRTQSGAVLEFADFKNWLVEEGRADGAEYRFDARVSKPLMEGGEIVGVVYDGDEEVRGEVIIDATGPSAPLAKKLGVVDLQREKQAIGVEYEYEGVDVDPDGYANLTDAMMLRLDHRMAPGGYSWLFHTGGDTAKVGVCYIQNAAHRENAREDFTIDDYLTNWVDSDPRFADAERLEGKQHRGSAHIQPPTSMSTDGFMAIGDTVPTLDPLWGEGIDKCMRSGRAAAATVDACLTPEEPDTSAEAVSVYDRLWHDEVAPKARTRLVMTELLYLASNDRYDRLVADLNRLGPDTLTKANQGNVRAILNLLRPGDAPLLAKYLRNRYLG